MLQWVDPLAMPPLRVQTFVALLHTFKKARSGNGWIYLYIGVYTN